MDFSIGGLQCPEQHFYQCGFTSTILAKEGVNFSMVDFQINMIASHEGTKDFRQSPHIK